MTCRSKLKWFIICLGAFALTLTATIITQNPTAPPISYQFLSSYSPVYSHTDRSSKGVTIVTTHYSFKADYHLFCATAKAELLANGYKDISRSTNVGHQDYIKMTTEQINVTFLENSKANADSEYPELLQSGSPWMTVTISRVQPKNKFLFMFKVWASHYIPVR